MNNVIDSVCEVIRTNQPYEVELDFKRDNIIINKQFSVKFGDLLLNYYSEESFMGEHVDVFDFCRGGLALYVTRSRWSYELANFIDNLNQLHEIR